MIQVTENTSRNSTIICPPPISSLLDVQGYPGGDSTPIPLLLRSHSYVCQQANSTVNWQPLLSLPLNTGANSPSASQHFSSTHLQDALWCPLGSPSFRGLFDWELWGMLCDTSPPSPSPKTVSLIDSFLFQRLALCGGPLPNCWEWKC